MSRAFLRRPEVRLPSDEERKGIEEMLWPGGAARKARVLTKTTTKKPTLTKEKPNNENKNTRSKASTTTHSFTAEDKDLLVFMVKETQKKNSHLDFRNFLEQTTLKEYKKRMLDPNRHEWKTLNEYVQTISKGYMNHLYEKYQNIRNETEDSKDESNSDYEVEQKAAGTTTTTTTTIWKHD